MKISYSLKIFQLSPPVLTIEILDQDVLIKTSCESHCSKLCFFTIHFALMFIGFVLYEIEDHLK